MIGLAAALGCTVFFASRDNFVRWRSGDTTTAPFVAAAATFVGGALVMALYLAVTRRRRVTAAPAARSSRSCPRASLRALVRCLFQAYYRGRVTVVSPLVATESLWGVVARCPPPAPNRARRAAARPRCGRSSVAGGALIGAFR
jgi:hypothetical protein